MTLRSHHVRDEQRHFMSFLARIRYSRRRDVGGFRRFVVTGCWACWAGWRITISPAGRSRCSVEASTQRAFGNELS